MTLYNEQEIRKTIEQLFCPGDVYEVRIIGHRYPLNGIFNNVDTLIQALKTVDLRNVNVYVTLQGVNPDCMSMSHANHFLKGAEAVKDNYIEAYHWLMIDIDPVRLTKISSSKSELEEAYKIAGEVCTYMSELGFTEPVKARSGNGAHLLYSIGLRNTSENTKLVENCLKALSIAFDTETCNIDQKVFNPSRVCKLYGTLAQKGSNTEERPYRMSKIIGDLKAIEVNKKETLQRLANTLPKPDLTDRPAPNKYNNYNAKSFDLDDFLNKHGVRYRTVSWEGKHEKYILDCCPFNSDHKGKDAVIFKYDNGALAFKCFHNSCRDKEWRDVRMLFEPNAYEREYQEANDRISKSWQKYNANRPAIVPEIDGNEQAFLSMLDIANNDEPEPEYIRTGFEGIDVNTHGLVKGGLSVISGMRGAGKSNILHQLLLNATEYGYKTVVYSGELSAKQMATWVQRQAAGPNNVFKPNNKVDDWFVKKEYIMPIAQWLDGKFWLYNNKLGNNFDDFIQRLQRLIEQKKIDLVILDNLMAFDIVPTEIRFMNIYEAQKRFVQMIKAVATKYNVHILYVAHPRKNDGYLRLNDVGGSGDLTNMVDLALILHKNNKDYQVNVTQYYTAEEAYIERHEEGTGKNKEVFYVPLCDTVVEICKDRATGNTDKLIPLWFDKKSKRVLNRQSENIVYGWQENYNIMFDDDEKGW